MFSSLTTPISETARHFGSRLRRREASCSIASTDRAGQQITKQIPACAVESRHLHLFDRREIGRAGVGRDTWQEHRHGEIMQAPGLLHDVLAGQLIAALL